jgi:hypothetical protein
LGAGAHVGSIEGAGITNILNLKLSGDLGALDGQGAGTPILTYGYISGLTIEGDCLAQVHAGAAPSSIVTMTVKGAVGDSEEDPEAVGVIRTMGDVGVITAGAVHAAILPGSLNSSTPIRDISALTCSTSSGFSGGGHFTGQLLARELLRR